MRRADRRAARVATARAHPGAGHDASIEDLGSKNGTFLRGRKVTSAANLEDGDEIGIGGARFTFRAAYGPGSTVTG